MEEAESKSTREGEKIGFFLARKIVRQNRRRLPLLEMIVDTVKWIIALFIFVTIIIILVVNILPHSYILYLIVTLIICLPVGYYIDYHRYLSLIREYHLELRD
jgi:hypothetical protein